MHGNCLFSQNLQKMTKNIADLLRDKDMLMIDEIVERFRSNEYKKLMPGKLYGLKVSNTRQKSKLSKIDLDDPLEGELQLTQMPLPLMDRNRIRTALRSLSNGACVNDDVVVCFSKMFNEWEYKTFLADSNYRGAIVITSNLVEKLCFQRNSRTLRTAYDPDSFHRSLTMTLGKGLEKSLQQ